MRIIFFFLFIIVFITSKAQKLPEVQNFNLSSPVGIRIDGKLGEWDQLFAAENKRTEVFYSLANDDKNLYVIVKSASANAVSKIIAGGISFTVNTKGKKKEEDGFTITYPVIARNATNRNANVQGQNRPRANQSRNEQTQQQRDSATLVQRKTMLAGVKEIKIAGFKSISDSLISIYNENGIKAVAKMDDEGSYCYEMAVPFAMLGIADFKDVELAYQIKLNGRPEQGNFTMRNNAGGGGFGGNNGRGNFGGGNANAARQDLMSATDFWGKYPLQKK